MALPDVDAALAAFGDADPFFQMGYACAGLAFLAWALSILTNDYSWVDRLWSTAPVLYTGYVAYKHDFGDARVNLMALLVACWGVRLTYNFAIKGGYIVGEQDYRWVILQQKMSPLMFQAFNATFIAPFQMALIYAFCSPVHLASRAAAGNPTSWSELTTGDYIALTGFCFFLLGEAVADSQMFHFQAQKRKARGSRSGPQFYTRGLYKYSRHPNYFCEICIWWCFYVFGTAAGGALINWTVSGPLFLTLLINGSADFTETISVSKYPTYTEYQRAVSKLMPMPPRSEKVA
mmetsp:Transcript_12687/g.46375  ORF Transcript_12687/g.46375 Transcript_12687/m.46375 type:complete len:291 (-) Transcript_12687:1579-2451(-)|eukprot:scaffold1541_cov418-Prasinococcus_capsulatus_cf.AAC.18